MVMGLEETVTYLTRCAIWLETLHLAEPSLWIFSEIPE
jgi:hypothetical protein